MSRLEKFILELESRARRLREERDEFLIIVACLESLGVGSTYARGVAEGKHAQLAAAMLLLPDCREALVDCRGVDDLEKEYLSSLRIAHGKRYRRDIKAKKTRGQRVRRNRHKRQRDVAKFGPMPKPEAPEGLDPNEHLTALCRRTFFEIQIVYDEWSTIPRFNATDEQKLFVKKLMRDARGKMRLIQQISGEKFADQKAFWAKYALSLEKA